MRKMAGFRWTVFRFEKVEKSQSTRSQEPVAVELKAGKV